MKKLFLLLIVILSLVCLSSCGFRQNEWPSDKVLSERLIPDFPEISENYVVEGNFVVEGDMKIYVNFTEGEYNSYINEVFEYLKSKNFTYLGTRGEFCTSLSGAFASYYFKEAYELSEFYSDGAYRFVYSNEDRNVEDPNFCVIVIYNNGFYRPSILEYNDTTFRYNTTIKLCYRNEYPASDYYVLEHLCSYDYDFDEEEHWLACIYGCRPLQKNKHVDNNNDNACDDCGYPISVRNCEFKWVGSDNGHSKLALCDCCDYPAVEYPHKNDNADLVCDLCGHDLRTVNGAYLRDVAGCEWLYDVAAEDVAEIRFTREAVGVAPGAFKYITVSDNEDAVIRLFGEFLWLDCTPISKESGEIEGGNAITVKFIMKDGSVKEICFNNGNYRDTNGDYYRPSSLPAFSDDSEYTSRWSFISWLGTAEIWGYDDSVAPYFVCRIPIDEIEFVETEAPDRVVQPNYFLETDSARYMFVSSDVFVVQGGSTYYKLVGKNLYELIGAYTIE